MVVGIELIIITWIIIHQLPIAAVVLWNSHAMKRSFCSLIINWSLIIIITYCCLLLVLIFIDMSIRVWSLDIMLLYKRSNGTNKILIGADRTKYLVQFFFYTFQVEGDFVNEQETNNNIDRLSLFLISTKFSDLIKWFLNLIIFY